MRSRSSGCGFLRRLLLLVLDWIEDVGLPARGSRACARRLLLGTQFRYLAGPIFPELVSAARECLLHALRPPGFARCPVLPMSRRPPRGRDQERCPRVSRVAFRPGPSEGLKGP